MHGEQGGPQGAVHDSEAGESQVRRFVQEPTIHAVDETAPEAPHQISRLSRHSSHVARRTAIKLGLPPLQRQTPPSPPAHRSDFGRGEAAAGGGGPRPSPLPLPLPSPPLRSYHRRWVTLYIFMNP